MQNRVPRRIEGDVGPGYHIEKMDPVWTQLPLDISEKICNKLPQVRGVSAGLKHDIRFGVLDRTLTQLDRYHDRFYNVNLLVDNLLMVIEKESLDWLPYNGYEYGRFLDLLWAKSSHDVLDEVVREIHDYMAQMDEMLEIMVGREE